MKKILLVILFLFVTFKFAYSDNQSVKVDASNTKSSVFAGEGFVTTVHMTNTGVKDIKLVSSQYCKFKEQWIIDNPEVQFFGGVCLTSPLEEIVLKPGQGYTDRVNLFVPTKESSNAEVVFKIGFKEDSNSPSFWSSPIRIQIEENVVLPVKIDVSTQAATIKSWESIEVSAHISNPSSVPQNIGTEICGVHGVVGWITNDKLVYVQGGSRGCMRNIYPPQEIILKTGEIYEQKCTVSFDKQKIDSGPLIFRIGLKNTGHLPAWSNDINVNVQGATEGQKALWLKSSAYQQKFMKEEDVTSAKDGIVKRFYESGELYDERSVKDGKLDGPVKYYYKNRILKKEVTYVKGDPTHWVDYNEDGSVQFDSTPLDAMMKSH